MPGAGRRWLRRWRRAGADSLGAMPISALIDAARQALRQRLPRRAAVGRLEDAAVGALPRAVFPRPLPLLPHRGVDDVGVGGIDVDVLAAGVHVLEQHALEVLAAVGGAEDAALLVGSVRVAERGDEEAVRDCADRSRAWESAARRAGRGASRSRRRRWICRCRRRPTGPDAAALRRCAT